MNFSGQNLKKLSEALIAAFPDKSSLERMLTFELSKNLNAIAGGDNLTEIVGNLLTKAKVQGWIEDLICAACESNPQNPTLQSAVQGFIVKSSNHLYKIIEEKLNSNGYFDLEELGTGASGITYLARRKDDQNYIVVKTIKNDVLYQKIIKSSEQESQELNQAITSFKEEASILSKLKHRHIASYCDHLTINFKFIIKNPCINKDDNKLYLVRNLELLFLIMEYIEGQNLDQFFGNSDTHLAEAEALRYIQQIGEALILVHNQSILHRDIKPQNIMVRKATKDAVLIDFGIAREFKPMVSQTHTVAFTEGYAPPEQLERKSKRGKYTDVYGLAATLYYLLTKEHPTHAFKRKSDSSSFKEPKNINPSISDTVNEAILWGMELEPSKRPQTVQQWLEKLLPPTEEPKPEKILQIFKFEVEEPKPEKILQIFEFEVVAVNSRGEITKRQSTKTAQYFNENLGNNVTLEMVAIPSGKFMMGSPSVEAQRCNEESPLHEVTVPAFFMGKYPVTQAQWRAVANLKQVSRKLNPDPSDFKGDNFPIEQVSWYEAVEFCDRLSRNTGQNYRLPSEAEWEYACRSGTTTPFHVGETITSKLANYDSKFTYCDEAKGKFVSQVTPIGSFIANAFGLYDMHGNVWEWCYDHWHDTYESAPNDGSAWINEAAYNTENKTPSRRVLRGGCWRSEPRFCRSAYRNHHEAGSRNEITGFRVVVSASKT